MFDQNELVYRPATRSAPAPESASSRADAREKSASDMCEGETGSEARGRVCKLIDLVSSSSIDDTVRVFTEADALRSSLFLQDPLLLKSRGPRRHRGDRSPRKVLFQI